MPWIHYLSPIRPEPRSTRAFETPPRGFHLFKLAGTEADKAERLRHLEILLLPESLVGASLREFREFDLLHFDRLPKDYHLLN
jgi:hypothetical protein